MDIRPMTPADMNLLGEIDATVDSTLYLHIERIGEGLDTQWKMQPRELHQKRTHRRKMDVDQIFTIKQIASGADDGIALVAEHEGELVAAAAARIDPVAGVMRLVDIRVDFDFRRQGLASAMIFQIIQAARDKELRAVLAEATADCYPAISLLIKLGFEPGGLDTHYRSNHDLV